MEQVLETRPRLAVASTSTLCTRNALMGERVHISIEEQHLCKVNSFAERGFRGKFNYKSIIFN